VAEFLRRESVQIGIPLPALSPGTLAVLSSNRWPGNVAELRDTVVRLLRESPKAVIDGGDLERVLGDDRVGDGLSTLSERNRLYTIEVLERTGGNKSRAAAVLGITRVRVVPTRPCDPTRSRAGAPCWPRRFAPSAHRGRIGGILVFVDAAARAE